MQDLATKMNIPFLETSAKTSENVEAAFLKMASEIKTRIAMVPDGIGDGRPTTKINSSTPVEQSTSLCCWRKVVFEEVRMLTVLTLRKDAALVGDRSSVFSTVLFMQLDFFSTYCVWAEELTTLDGGLFRMVEVTMEWVLSNNKMGSLLIGVDVNCVEDISSDFIENGSLWNCEMGVKCLSDQDLKWASNMLIALYCKIGAKYSSGCVLEVEYDCLIEALFNEKLCTVNCLLTFGKA